MKVIVLFLAVACLALERKVPTYRLHTADKAYLVKQKKIYELYWHVDQPTVYHPELYQIAQAFNFKDNVASFKNQAAVNLFIQRLKHGIVPRGVVFSGTQYFQEALNLFHVLHSAKDFDTFYNAAVWARFNVNENVYIYALSAAVLHRADTRHIHLPPIYEVFPYYFFNEEVIHRAHHIAMGNTQNVVKETKNNGTVNCYYIYANYSDWYIVHDHGVSDYHKLSYFTEDVGLTSFYIASTHDFPPWLSSVTHHFEVPAFVRGELYLYLHRQILARYNLERLSHNLDDVDYVDVNRPVFPYYPRLQHPNGVSFPQRPVGFEIPAHVHEDVQRPVYNAVHDSCSEPIVREASTRMKAIALLLATVCLAQATQQVRIHTADKAYLGIQKKIYELFWHVDQPTVYHPELYQKARAFNLEDNVASFNDQAAITEFLQRLKHGIIPRGVVFSGPQHIHEAINLFHVFYSAKDFDTFYDAAVWARFNVNEYVYIYALSVAVLHRPDTRHVRLPPVYEVLPYYFFNEEVIHQAHHIALGNTQIAAKKTVGSVDYYYIPANYSDWYIVHDHGVSDYHKLSYFTEDVGLTSFYIASIHEFPHWLSSAKHHLPQFVRGELYLYLHHQILARYNLERLSHNLDEVDYVDVNKPIVPYYPTLQYPNGVSFPQRPVGFQIPVHVHENVQALQDSHVRISDAIDSGHIVDAHGKQIDIYKTVDGLNQLGNIIEGNADSVNPGYYGHLDSLYRKVFGVSQVHHTSSNQVVPGALDLLSTRLRDPLFYGIYKNIVSYWTKYKQHLPKYTHEELVFPGVHIESVTVDKLVTFFDHFDSLLSNTVSVSSHKEAQSTVIKARQNRLNHKPFSYHITVHSDKDVKAIVRVFIGPKYNVHGHEVDLSESHHNFLELDQWVVDLVSGTNKLERSSHEFIYVAPDEIPSDVLYKKVVKAIEGGEAFTYPEQLYGFPERLVLPRGKKEGLQFKLFVAVSHFDETSAVHVDSPIWGSNVVDARSLGYPLDRPIPYNFTEVPNFHIRDVVITHKQVDDLNQSNV